MVLQRAATLSPSATISLITLWLSGKAASHSSTNRFMFSRPASWGLEEVWSMYPVTLK